MVFLWVHLIVVLCIVMAQSACPELTTYRAFLLAPAPIVLAPKFGVIESLVYYLILLRFSFFLLVFKIFLTFKIILAFLLAIVAIIVLVIWRLLSLFWLWLWLLIWIRWFWFLLLIILILVYERRWLVLLVA